MAPSHLILGLGNTLLSDEAVGIEVVRRLAAAADLPGAVLLDGGTLSFTLAAPIAESTHLVVVDAALMGAIPGSVKVYRGEAFDRRLRGSRQSVHEVSLQDLMDIARLTDTLPSHRALVGIEPARVAMGEGLSAPVRAAVPAAMAAVRDLVAEWDAHALDDQHVAQSSVVSPELDQVSAEGGMREFEHSNI